MAHDDEHRSASDDKALELKMAETLSGLADFATAFGYRSVPNTVEILSVEAPRAPRERLERAPVYRVPLRRSNDVVSFLIERESRGLRRIA